MGAFLLALFGVVLGIRWFRSRKAQDAWAKSLGAFWLVVFVPALLALMPGQLHWKHVIPIEGLLGRIVTLPVAILTPDAFTDEVNIAVQ